MRYFTLEEAEALIPRLDEIFEAVADLAAKAEAKAERIYALERAQPLDESQVAIEKGQLRFLGQAVARELQKIADLGAIPKGLEPALVDFPARVEGREAYLCWKLGEKKITHYHGIADGFAGRRRLPRR